MELRLQPWSYTSAARHWAGPLGSLLPSCEARGVWCPKARSCTWKESGLITQLIPYISPLKKRNWKANEMFQLKPWKHFCNHWHLRMTLWYFKHVQLDHFLDSPSMSTQHRCSVPEVTGQLKALALPRSKGKVDDQGSFLQHDTMTMTQCQYLILQDTEGNTPPMSTTSDP